MPRIQVYLPDDLYKFVKTSGLSPSELLQRAIRVELRRAALMAEADEYVAELFARVGTPSERERKGAAALADRITRRAKPSAG